MKKQHKISVKKYCKELFTKKRGFTLAEALITLTIIGVVAALTVPALMTEMGERINSEREVAIVQKITKSMEMMKVEGKLGSFESTDDFVDELQNYLKVIKRCDSDHLAECWPTEKIMNAEKKWVSVANARTGDNLGFISRTSNKNVGLILADGTCIILTYDPEAPGMLDVELSKASSVELPIGFGKSKTFSGYTTNVTSGLAFIVDVNGASKPNKETIEGVFNDIRSFNGAHFTSSTGAGSTPNIGGKVDEYYIVQIASFNPARCMHGSTEPYCAPLGTTGLAEDYQAGAMKACLDIGMTLPTVDVLQQICVKGGDGVPSSGMYVSSSKGLNYLQGRAVDFSSGRVEPQFYRGDPAAKVLCVSK